MYQKPRTRITVTETVTTTYEADSAWLAVHGFPDRAEDLDDYLNNGMDYSPADEDPVDSLATALGDNEDISPTQFDVTERYLVVEPI